MAYQWKVAEAGEAARRAIGGWLKSWRRKRKLAAYEMADLKIENEGAESERNGESGLQPEIWNKI